MHRKCSKNVGSYHFLIFLNNRKSGPVSPTQVAKKSCLIYPGHPHHSSEDSTVYLKEGSWPVSFSWWTPDVPNTHWSPPSVPSQGSIFSIHSLGPRYYGGAGNIRTKTKQTRIPSFTVLPMKQDLWARLVQGLSPSTKKSLGLGRFPQHSSITPISGSFSFQGRGFMCNLVSVSHGKLPKPTSLF